MTYIVCIDGTWNRPGQKDVDPKDDKAGVFPVEREAETNVLRVFRFLTGLMRWGGEPVEYGTEKPLRASFGPTDDLGRVMYLSGVGSSGTVVSKGWAGATGTGTSERILDAYRFLAANHAPGDRIFGFGFSRGAFAVRSLAGFLQFSGLPEVPRLLTDQELDDRYRQYRERGSATTASGIERAARADFLGLWDTVGALAFGGVISNFHVISPANVKRVAHALALDERRGAFEPEYWKSYGTDTTVNEVWFPGVHSNVGGGYADQGLSNIALAWVVSQAVEAGLPSERGYIDGWYGENQIGRDRDSYKEFLKRFGLIGDLARRVFVGKMNRVVLDHQQIHSDVFERIRKSEEPYLPAARLASGQGFPTSVDAFDRQRIVETPDYLDVRELRPPRLPGEVRG